MTRNPLPLVLALAGAACAQIYRDPFNYPNGTVVPGWTERRGDWVIANNRLHLGTPGNGLCFITKDGFNLRNSVCEALVTWEGPIPLIEGGGLTARHNGSNTEMGMILAMVQDNLAQGSFNALMLFEQGGSGVVFRFPLIPFIAARVRLLVAAGSATVQVDTDRNGTWDISDGTPLDTLLAAGGNGCSSVFKTPNPRSSGIDDFALFDGVLSSTGVPRPGSTVTLRLQVDGAGLPYQLASAFSNAPGVPVDSRNIPLVPDALTLLSLSLPTVFQGYTGVTGANGAALAQIAFPPVSQLAGVAFYTVFVTLSPAAPSGIVNISNDHRIDIVP